MSEPESTLYETLPAKVRAMTRPYDAAHYLNTEEETLCYLKAALKDGDPRIIATVLGAITRARGRMNETH